MSRTSARRCALYLPPTDAQTNDGLTCAEHAVGGGHKRRICPEFVGTVCTVLCGRHTGVVGDPHRQRRGSDPVANCLCGDRDLGVAARGRLDSTTTVADQVPRTASVRYVVCDERSVALWAEVRIPSPSRVLELVSRLVRGHLEPRHR